MTLNKTPNPPPRGKPTEPWRVERMVQPVPGHLGEEARFSPWLIVAAVAVIVIIGAVLLLLTQLPSSPEPQPAVAPATSIAPTKRVTVIKITATPEATFTPTAVPTQVVVKYTVKKGDTLSTIARQFKTTVEAIRAANNLTDDTLHPGDVLNIPQGTPGAIAEVVGTPDTGGASGPPTNTPFVFRTPTLIVPPTATQVLATTPTPTPGVVTYVVRPNDTLIGIASIYSTTVQAIMDMSKITSISLKVGQTLTVPVGIWAATSVPPTVFTSPTPTKVPEFPYAAPDLLSPADGADFAHDTPVTLQWLSLGIKKDEYSVVHIRYVANGLEFTLPVRTVRYDEGTSVTLTTPPTSSGTAQFSWYVVVLRDGSCSPSGAGSAQPCAVSPPSETSGFTWR